MADGRLLMSLLYASNLVYHATPGLLPALRQPGAADHRFHRGVMAQDLIRQPLDSPMTEIPQGFSTAAAATRAEHSPC